MFLPHPPIYGTFGNFRYGDCAYVAAANIEQTVHRGIRISTGQVVRLWQAGGSDAGVAVGDLMAGDFGPPPLADHEVLSPTRADLQNGLRFGPVYAWGNIAPNTLGVTGGAHAFAVLGATSKGLQLVSAGQIYHEPWAWWSAVASGIFSFQWN